MENKKEIFKLLIKQFHELKPPRIIKRDYQLPDYCTSVTPEDPLLSPAIPSRPSSVIAVTGPRRSGKTYFMHQLIEHFCQDATSPVPRNCVIYINFEDDRLLPLSVSDLAALSDAYFELYPDNRDKEVFIFLDEIHHAEGWELFLRRLLDQENVRLFITSSSSKFRTRFQSSALFGRTLEFAILPLSFKEFLVFKGLDVTPDFAYSSARFKAINLLDEYITYGGYPEVVLTDPALKFRILKNYYDLFVYKDLVEQFGIRNIELLKGLLKYLITNIGSRFSINSYFLDVRRDLHISRETVLDYVSFLEQKGLISFVPILSDYLKVRRVNPKKVYSLDNGIRNAVSFPLQRQDEGLAKNLVFQKLVRSGNEVFYWKCRREVDFVARQNGKLRAINVSYGRELSDRETSPLLEFKYSTGEHDAEMTIITKDTEKTDRGISFSPLWKWLLAP
jgi:predicted AAA+ superfamily ATPase